MIKAKRYLAICGGVVLAVSAVGSTSLLAAEFSGIPVQMSMVPEEITKAIPVEITTDQFKARLKQGGTLTLDGTTLTVGPPDPSNKSLAFMAFDKLELKNGAKIVTNGNILVLFANTISSETGKILSFDEANSSAAPGPVANGVGGNGNPGVPGLAGGVVSLHVVQGLDGILTVDLHGQSGGNGSDGFKGGTPPKAGRGGDAQDGPGGYLTPGWCKAGGQNGEGGKPGYQGGQAGSGGKGGDGGYLELINVGAMPIPSASYTYSAKAGSPGKAGNKGAGGDGGEGGDGGHGSTWCSGGRGGPRGPTGPVGTTPADPVPASDGKSVVKNLDLEVLVRTSVIPVPSKP